MKHITLSKGYSCVVSDEDYEFITGFGKWCTQVKDSGNLYAVRTINYKNEEGKWTTSQLKMHDVLASRIFGDIPDDMLVDHADRNTLNNCRTNLRICTRSQNQANRFFKKETSASKYKGVTKGNGENKWRAKIMCRGKRVNIGTFHSEKQAALAYNEAAKALFGEFACLNTIE